jgi:hypothetical protein
MRLVVDTDGTLAGTKAFALDESSGERHPLENVVRIVWVNRSETMTSFPVLVLDENVDSDVKFKPLGG